MNKTIPALFLILFVLPIFSSVYSQNQSFSRIYQVIGAGRLTEAADMLESYVRQNPDSLNGYLTLSRVFLAIGGPNNHTSAERVLISAIKKFPKNVPVMKLLAKVKETQNMPDHAARWMAEAAKADPNDQRLLLDLLTNYIREGKANQAKNMRGMIETALRKNSANPVNYIAMGKLEVIEGKYKDAISTVEKGLVFDSAEPEFFRILAEAYLRDGQGNEFTENYYTYLSLEDDLEVLEEEYAVAELTMPNETADEFRSLPWNERRSYLLKHWRDSDPYPVTPANERLIEHERRILYSLDAFRTEEGTLGFDDRGKVYIQWGEPPERFTEPALSWSIAEIKAAGSKDPATDPFMRPLDEVGLPHETESWYYPQYGYYAAFDFVNKGGYFHEVPTLADAVAGSNLTSISQILYMRRVDLGGVYRNLAHATDGQSFLSNMNEFMLEKMTFKRNETPIYEIGLDMKNLDYVKRMSQFRGDSGRTKIEFAYGVPLMQEVLKTGHPESHEYNFETAIVFLDSLRYRTIDAHSSRKYVPLPERDYPGYFVDDAREEIAPGSYELTFQVVEQSLKAGRYDVTPFTARDFSRNALMLSDLKFSFTAVSGGIDPATGVERVSTEPYPFPFVKKSNPVYLYFEVYNLTASPNGGSRYRISLAVERKRTTGEYFTLPIASIGSIFTAGQPRRIETEYGREGGSKTGVEYVNLDVSGLEGGHSRLTVTAEDLNAGTKAVNSIEFELMD